MGYGYDSIEALAEAAKSVNAAAADTVGRISNPSYSQEARRRGVLAEIDRRGILATPANSFINELVTEAARKSIIESGRHVAIHYTPTCGIAAR